MRFILIDSTLRRAIDYQTPRPLGHQLFCELLESDSLDRVELAPGLDLWLSTGPWRRTFQFFRSGAEFAGNGILAGRTLLDDFKSLPRAISFETVTAWVNYPEVRFEAPQPRRKYQRPTGLPLIGPPLHPYHRTAPEGAGENPYLMQMYG
ncbi:MAG: hypothetical protein E5W43_05540 [Mesorhizobium sp.]|nr:MAG: hypothetical protein E5W43_05540 [Mesorhizobium sp.]